MRRVQQSDVLSLNRDTGELAFRFTIDDPVSPNQAVSLDGIGYIVTDVDGDNDGGYVHATAKVVDLVDLGARPFAMTLMPGDVVVLQVERPVSSDIAERIRQQGREAFPGHNVVVLTDDLILVGKVTP